MKLWTVGYEGLDLQDLLGLLQDAGIQRVVDVRADPVSRKKGFSKRPLSEALEHAGITYDLRRSLGVEKGVRDAYREGGPWEPFAAWYNEHLETQGVEIAAVAHHAMQEPTALLCFEADPHACHRSLLADRLVTAGFEVAHLGTTSH